MTVRGKVVTDTQSGLLVPGDAIHDAGNGEWYVEKVIKKESNDSTRVPITIVLRGSDNMVVVKGGIEEGDEVLITEKKQ
jgi:multidrug efflux pump subunit AcrA (membrane-fusion protein)